MSDFDYKKLPIQLLKPLNGNDIPDNFFRGKKVVFTGDLSEWDRPTAAYLVQRLGADVNTAVSKKTHIVIVGYNAGPSKLNKIIDLLSDGVEIKLMNERLFNESVKDYLSLLTAGSSE